MFTKPCGRADRGCLGLAHARTPRILAQRQFCSYRCGYLDRVERGVQPQWKLTPEARREAGRKGGANGAAKRRKAAIHAHVTKVTNLIPRDLMRKLTHREQALVALLLTKSYERGYRRGSSAEQKRSSRMEQAQKVTEAA